MRLKQQHNNFKFRDFLKNQDFLRGIQKFERLEI